MLLKEKRKGGGGTTTHLYFQPWLLGCDLYKYGNMLRKRSWNPTLGLGATMGRIFISAWN